MAPLVWLVTGSTSGIGAALIEQITARGDKVIASGRNVDQKLGHLKSDKVALLELDITADFSQIEAQMEQAWGIFGHIDVLMNNAGMSALKSAEEADDAFVSQMFQVNLFGHMNAARAILPLLRERGSGVIAFTSSSSAWMALPFMSHYAASKAALSAYIEGLDREVRSFGIRCIAFECGGFPTRLGQPRDANQEAFGSGGPAIAGYLPLFMELSGIWVANPMGHMPGDLRKCGERIVDVVKREGMASGLPWAVRVALGSDAMGYVEQKCDEQLQLLDAWKDVSRSTDRDGQENVANKEMFKFTTALEE